LRLFLAGRRFEFERWLRNPRAQRELAARAWLRLRRPVRPVRTEYGTVFVDLRDTGVGWPLYVLRQYEEAEARFLRSCLRPGMTHLDVGANVGYLTAVAASRVGRSGRVVAVEPDPHNFRLLGRGIRANGWTQVTALNAAAGAESGAARLYKSGANLGDHRLYADGEARGRAAVKVPVIRLDDLFGPGQLAPPEVVKLDVQGYEGHVVRGLERVLAAGRPMAVLTEFWPHGMANAGTDPREDLATFRRHGFGCYRPVADGSVRPVGWDEVWGLVPPFDPAEPGAAWVNLVFSRGGVGAG
jgi:FkbM family methyltransferase